VIADGLEATVEYLLVSPALPLDRTDIRNCPEDPGKSRSSLIERERHVVAARIDCRARAPPQLDDQSDSATPDAGSTPSGGLPPACLNTTARKRGWRPICRCAPHRFGQTDRYVGRVRESGSTRLRVVIDKRVISSCRLRQASLRAKPVYLISRLPSFLRPCTIIENRTLRPKVVPIRVSYTVLLSPAFHRVTANWR
jgi:hypothetical protein